MCSEKSKAAYLMLRFGGAETNARQRQRRRQRRRALRARRSRRATARSASRPRSGTTTRSASGQGACNAADNGTNQATDIQCWLTPALLAFSTGDGTRQHARQDLHQRAAELQRALRLHGQAVHALRLFEGHVAAGLRPAAQLRGHQRAADRHQQQLAVPDPRRAGQRHGLQLRVRGRSRLRGPRSRSTPTTSTCRTKRTIGKSSSFTLGLFYKQLENAIAYGRAVRDITTTARRRP